MVNTILDEKDSQYFGFTSEEVSDMAAYYGKKERLSEIQSWYDGQRYTAHSIVSIWIMNRESGRQKGAYGGLNYTHE